MSHFNLESHVKREKSGKMGILEKGGKPCRKIKRRIVIRRVRLQRLLRIALAGAKLMTRNRRKGSMTNTSRCLINEDKRKGGRRMRETPLSQIPGPLSLHSRWRRGLAARVCILVLAAASLSGCMINTLQERLIYHPRPYGVDYQYFKQASFFQEIPYQTREGRQVALYVAPKDPAVRQPERLWVFFGGNMSLALFWKGLVERAPDRRAGFLLFDYPGYGNCQGHSSPASILESARAGMTALAGHLRINPQQLYRHLNIFGYSLGTAAALQLAAKIPEERVLLVAPFSSMWAMARRQVGWPFYLFLTHRFDNQARLKELAARAGRPQVVITHGDHDDVVPVQMSRDMAHQFDGWVEYQEVPGANHLQIVQEAETLVDLAMLQDMGYSAAGRSPGPWRSNPPASDAEHASGGAPPPVEGRL